MIPSLIEKNMADKDENGIISLTPDGARHASSLYLKHLTFYKFFSVNLGESKENARKNAISCLCSFSDESTESITDYILKEKEDAAI